MCLPYRTEEQLKQQNKLINAEDILLDILLQVCRTERENIIDNQCLSCYERACDYLEKIDMLENINGRLYKVKEE